MTSAIKSGYTVTAEDTGAQHPNSSNRLPYGMTFVLRKNGKKRSEHCTHTSAWQTARRRISRDTIIAKNTAAGFPPIDYSQLA